MKKILQQFVSTIKTTSSFSTMLAIGVLVSLGLSAHVYAYSTVDSQLDFGEKNADVTSLQTFFADNAAVYPSGLVTGYFGSLTRAGVIRFQSLYGIDQAGRVGPVTRDKINSLINAGGWGGVVSTDVSGPQFYSVYQNQTNNSVTFTFVTNEGTTARVVYNTNPLMFNEGASNSAGFGPLGGYSASSASGLSTSHSVMLTNLQANTTYYYTVIVTDAAGNVSVWGPNNTVRTNVQ